MHLSRLFPTLSLVLLASCNLTEPENAGTTGDSEPVWKVDDISATKAARLKEKHPDIVVLDVRTPGEFAEGHVKGAVNVDFKSADFEKNIAKLDGSQTYVIHCRSGNRSGKALPVLKKSGFGKVYHMDGGFNEWKAKGLPVAH
ncbi:MAG: rhodanese-like domain-containing protein [Verrucomicrobiae bacterium]|nr:rhodanese-like domain-containing protein [Verrucomicrobiae bacterium]NNJ86842.1 rhodanese-like domain-containing protein [Akkermansiaceae bacterium]